MSGKQKIADALARLKQAREGGVATRLDQLALDDRDAEPDYESMDEAQYQAYQTQSKREAREFLVDDEGIGYLEDDSPKRQPSKKSRKRGPLEEKVAPKKKRSMSDKTNEPTKKTQNRLPSPKLPDVVNASSQNDALETQLNELALKGTPPPTPPTAPPEKPNEPTRIAPRKTLQTEIGIGEDTLPFFFLDADDYHESHGTVYLFGKVENEKGYVSCCVRIPAVERAVYFIPKEGLFDSKDYRLQYLERKATEDPLQKEALLSYLHQLVDPLKKEAQSLMKARISNGLFKMKIVQRNYAFDTPTIPHGLQYVLKVTFSAKSGSIPTNLQGHTFQAVLGTKQSLLESVLLRRRVMGPSWIALRHPTYIPTDQHLRNRPAPKLKVAALQLKTLHNPQLNVHEILMVTVVALQNVSCDHPMAEEEWKSPSSCHHYHALTHPKQRPWPPGFEEEMKMRGADVHESEAALLTGLLETLHQLDPDVLVGHDITSVDLSLLLHRMQFNKVENWSRLGRLKRTKFPSLTAKAALLSVMTGRLLCDTFISAHETLREVEFSLTALAKSQFHETRRDLTSQAIEDSYHDKKLLQGCLEHSRTDALLTLRILFHLSLLPLTKQLTILSGSLWNKTLQGQKAQRTDMLLLHEFHNRKFLLPEKKPFTRERTGHDWDRQEGKKSGPQYAGGLVLEPKKGLYDSMVLLLDFNSLYPSIIQEFKLCFTTVDRSSPQPSLPGPSAPLDAPLCTVIKGLIDSRRQVKQLIATEKDPTVLKQRKIREQALKLTANSMYGCLGFSHSRFFCKPLAELITAQGRAILQKTVDHVEKQLGYEVVYGDTDSIMIHTGSHNYEEVRHTMAEKIKKAINKDYRALKIDVDGVFQPLLLLKKKKYAAMKLIMHNGELLKHREDKGLDIVRRDWSKIAKNVGHQVLNEILSGKPSGDVIEAIHRHLRSVRERMERREVPLAEYEIVKELAKRPEEYTDAKSQPHVLVALRRKQQGHRDGIHAGSAIPYIICHSVDPTAASHSQAERAYHPEEVKEKPHELQIDTEFYLANQIHAVVSRLCEPIEGTDARKLAECLGLDGMRYRARQSTPPPSALPHQEQNCFQDCQPLNLTVGDPGFAFCGVDAILTGSVTAEAALQPPGELPSGLTQGQIANAATLQARQYISDYYDGYCRAEDEEEIPTRVPVYAEEEADGKWTRVVSEKQLYEQLSYLIRQLDVEGAIRRLKKAAEQEAALQKWDSLKQLLLPAVQILKEFRNECQYATVSFEELLRPL